VIGAVVVAAGRGERLGQDRPKALVEVAGRSLVAHTVTRLVAAGIDRIVVVHPSGDEDRFAAGLAAVTPAPTLVVGGATRGASVRAGLRALPADVEVVAVHDAARALQPPEVIAAAIAAVAGDVVAAAPAVAVTDTLKRVDGDRVVATVDRAGLVAIQTPQVFRADVLHDAHARGDDATDDLALVERHLSDGPMAGYIMQVAGAALGRKVTYGTDVLVAEALLAVHD
jgi:2-C-methyl-D-erythritol 4-phosphate cytidylyltransferase